MLFLPLLPTVPYDDKEYLARIAERYPVSQLRKMGVHLLTLDVLTNERELGYQNMDHLRLNHVRHFVCVSGVHCRVGVACDNIAEFCENITQAAIFFNLDDRFVCFSSARSASRLGVPCP